MAFIDDIKRTYRQGSMLMRLIFINIGVFILIRLLAIGAVLLSGSSFPVLQWVELPGDWWLALRRPWTLVTYMFVHNDLWHILFNMLWLYWLGRIFMEFFSSKQLSGLYILGGLGGGALYLLCSNLLGHLHGSALIGSSAAVIAIVVAVAVYVPDYKIGLLFLGQVAIKWVALVTVLIAVLSLDGGNIGGNIAHLGGAAVGAWYALRIKQGHDITRPLNAMLDFIIGLFNGRSLRLPRFKRAASPSAQQQAAPPRQATSTSHHRPDDTVSEEELDVILGKIKAAGYDALSDEEKDKLFKASRRRTP
ncbi:MAG: rhomboid family intramembrane serine protease [Muribaculaceae bacterium]|nr:rhomboid family intramembrane serine protease [Muribaculaceae bacterium]